MRISPLFLSHTIVMSTANNNDPEVSFIRNQMKQAQERAAAAPAPAVQPSNLNPAVDTSKLPDRMSQEKDAEIKFIMKQSFEAGKKK